MGRVFPKRERHKTGTGSGFEIITESGSIRSMTERGKQQQQHDDRRDGEINDKVADAVAPKLSISDTEPHGGADQSIAGVVVDRPVSLCRGTQYVRDAT